MAALLVVDVLGVLVVLQQPSLAIAVAAGLVVVLVALPALRRLRRDPWRAESRREEEPQDAEPADGLRVARVFYYLGMLFIAQLTFRPGTPFTVSDWLFLAALLTAAAVAVVTGRQLGDRPPRLLLAGVACFTLGGLLSSFTAAEPAASIATILRVVYVTLVWFWLGMAVLRTERHIRLAITFWVVSAAVTGAGAIVQLVFGDVIPGGEVAYGRMTSFTGQFNDLGGIEAVAFVPALMLAASSNQSLPRRAALLTALGLIGIGLFLSGSVSAFAGMSVAVLIWLIAGRARLGSFVVLAVAAAGGMVFLSAQGEDSYKSPLERITETTTSRDPNQATLRSRLHTYDLAWRRIEENPLVGVGLHPEGTETKGGRYYVHNILLRAWYEAGAPAIVGLVLVLLAILLAGWQAIVHARRRSEANLATALLAAWVAYGVFSMGQPSLFHRYGWVAAGLLLVLKAQQDRARAAVERSAEPAGRYGALRAAPGPLGA